MAVTIAIVFSVLVLIAALVIDIGLSRMDVRSNQRAADMAASAGAHALDPTATNGYQIACQQAWNYFLENTPDSDATQPSPCAMFADASFYCDSTTPVPASAPSGPYTVTVTMPVPDGHDLMAGQDLNPAVDGSNPCGRMGVTIVRDREYVFAGVAGFGSGSPVADAVARRASQGATSEFASLAVLDRTDCHALYSDGQGRVTVLTDASGTFEGFIAVDSAASGGNCDPTPGNTGIQALDVENTNNCKLATSSYCGVFASGGIFSYGIQAGNATTAYDSCDVDQGSGSSCNGKPVLLDPTPVRGTRVTRSIIDHRYNCLPTYPAYDATAAPQYPVDPIGDCTDGGQNPFIDDLVTAYGGSGAPAGFTNVVATYPSLLGDCTLDTGEGPLTISATEVYVDCAELVLKNELRFDGVKAIVLEGGIRLEGQGHWISDSGTADHVVYLRTGGIGRSGSDTSFSINRGVVYVHDPAGSITLAGGNKSTGTGTVVLIAPDTDGAQNNAACTTYSGAPPAECFEDLAVWANGNGAHDLAGQGGLDIRGTVFTPNAGRSDGSWFELRGQGSQVLDHAQFISHRLKVTGQGTISMRPDPDRNTPFPASGGGLIR